MYAPWRRPVGGWPPPFVHARHRAWVRRQHTGVAPAQCGTPEPPRCLPMRHRPDAGAGDEGRRWAARRPRAAAEPRRVSRTGVTLPRHASSTWAHTAWRLVMAIALVASASLLIVHGGRLGQAVWRAAWSDRTR